MTVFMEFESIVKRSRKLTRVSLAIVVSLFLASCGSEEGENNSLQTGSETAVWDESYWGETRWQ